MEITRISVFIVFVGLLIWAGRVVNWIWVRPKKIEKYLRRQGLAGNSYRILVGDLKESSIMRHQVISQPMNFSHDIASYVLPFNHHIVKNYGKNTFEWLGPRPRILIMDPERLKVVFSKFNDFQKPNLNPLSKLLATGLANYEGEKWAKHRKIINPAFQIEKVKHMLPAFDQSCRDMITKWERIASDEGSCELDVWPHLQNLSSDSISRTAFGSSYEEGRRIFELITEQGSLTIEAQEKVYVPGWRFVPTKLHKRMKEVDKEIQALLTGIINKREKARKAGEAPNSDLLGILMESNFKEIQGRGNNKNNGMSVKDVMQECKLFYLAGQETTSVLLVWTMILLSKYPECQDRARTEVLQVFGHNKPEFDGLSRLKVVTMILYEVLRLYPPVAILSRRVDKEIVLGHLSLPAGVLLALPIVFIHHDRELWGEDADEFKPERFAEGVSKATKNQFSFVPFGWGPRICIGQHFAMTEVKLALSIILQHFTFELSPSYTHAPLSLITLQPKHGAHIILHKR